MKFEIDKSKTPSSQRQLSEFEQFLDEHIGTTVFLDVEVIDAEFVFEAEDDPMRDVFGDATDYEVVYIAEKGGANICDRPGWPYRCQDQIFKYPVGTRIREGQSFIDRSAYFGVAIAVERNPWTDYWFAQTDGDVVLHGYFVPGEISYTKNIAMTPYKLRPVEDPTT